MRLRSAPLLVAIALLTFARPALGVFHLWEIKEIFSNADGSVQFVELFTSSPSETQVSGHQITASSDGNVVTFTFGSNLVGSTASKYLMIATPGFAALPGAVTPDFTLPCGPFFDATAGSITINFIGADAVTFNGASLPSNGTSSLTDTNLGGVANFVSGASSPTNFSAAAGGLSFTGCLQAGTCEPCDDGLFCNGAESCAASACTAGTACAGVCDEVNDTCNAAPVPAVSPWGLGAGAVILLGAGMWLLVRARFARRAQPR